MTKPCECQDGDRGWSPLNSVIKVNEDKSITIIPPIFKTAS